MRAYLSNSDARAEWVRERSLFGWPGDDEKASEREARAILAETEPYIAPMQDHTRSDMRLTLATRDYRGYAVAVDCLADALAVFVEGE